MYGIDGPRRRPTRAAADEATITIANPPAPIADAPPEPPPVSEEEIVVVADAAPADVHPSVPDVWRGESEERDEEQRSKDMQERFDTLRIELEAALDRRIRVAVDQMRTTFDQEIEALRTLNREEAKRIRAANDEAFIRIRVSNSAELERIRGAIDEGVARLCTVLEGQLDRVWAANDVELERIRSYGADRLADVHDLLMHKIERLREERSAMEPAKALEEAQAAVETRRWLRRRGVTAPH